MTVVDGRYGPDGGVFKLQLQLELELGHHFYLLIAGWMFVLSWSRANGTWGPGISLTPLRAFHVGHIASIAPSSTPQEAIWDGV